MIRRALALALCCATVHVHALPIQLDFSGAVMSPLSPYYGQTVDASLILGELLSLEYQADSSRDDCIGGVDALIGVQWAAVSVNGSNVETSSPLTAVFRADGMCSGFFSSLSLYDGDTRVGGFTIDLIGTPLSTMLAAENPFTAMFNPSAGASAFAFGAVVGSGYSNVSEVPEPATLLLLGGGLLGLALGHRRSANVLARVV